MTVRQKNYSAIYKQALRVSVTGRPTRPNKLKPGMVFRMVIPMFSVWKKDV